MNELLMPTTDAGVAAQVVGLMVLGLGAAVLARGRRELQTFIAGVVTLGLALMALRILH
ncbi:MAG: hypothetical protein R2754_15835 [Microthrixaceae bacterium]